MAYSGAQQSNPQDALTAYITRLHRICGYLNQPHAAGVADALLRSREEQGGSDDFSPARMQLAATLLRQAHVLNPFDGALVRLLHRLNSLVPGSPMYHNWFKQVEEFHALHPELGSELQQKLPDFLSEAGISQSYKSLEQEQNPCALLRGIFGFWERGQWEPIHVLSERLLKLPFGSLAGPLLAWAAWTAGDREKANEWLTSRVQPTFLSFNLHAEIAYAEGRTDAARQFLRRSLAWDPQQPHLIHRFWEFLQPSPSPLFAKDKKVHIVLSTANKLETTLRTLRSLLSSNIGSAAIYLLNNGSTAFSAGDLERGVKAVAQARPVHLIQLPAGIGAPAARSWIWHLPEMRAADYMAFLNNDVILPPDWLQLYLQDFELFPRAVVVGPRGLNPGSLPTVQYVHRYFQEVDDRGIRFTPTAPLYMDLGQYSYRHPCLSVTGCCHIFDRRRWEALGVPDFDIRVSPSQVNDLEHDIRIWKAGGEVVYDGRVKVAHFQQAGRQAIQSQSSRAQVEGNHTKMENQFSRAELTAIDRRVGEVDQHFYNSIEETVLQALRELDGQPLSSPSEIGLRGRSKTAEISSFACADHSLESNGSSIQNHLVNGSVLLSIIILSLNQWEWTRACVESIRRHTTLPYEIILVDNGSSKETVRDLLEFSRDDASISVVLNAENKGFALGNNQGMALARGEHALLLNNDTLVTEGWLEGLLKVLADYPKVGIVGPMSNYVAGPQIVEEASYHTIEQMESFASYWRQAHRNESFAISAVIGFCMLIRKSVIEAIGGLDPLFGIGNFEDNDFCYRASLAGFEIRVARDVFIHHQGSLTFKAENVDYVRTMKKNWELFKVKWGLDPRLPLGHPNLIIDTERVMRREISLPHIPSTHDCKNGGKAWFDRAKDAWA